MCTCSLLQRELNKVLEQNLADTAREEQQVKNLLLLGAGESGKSTIFKQMKTIYCKGTAVQPTEADGARGVLHLPMIARRVQRS